jgi:quercetin dioxygenase-like cupin family protein
MVTALEELDWEPVDELVRKKVVDGTSMTMTRYSFRPEGRFPHHVHDQEQVTMVIAGRLTFVIEGEDHVLEEGSVVVIPSGVPHSAVAGPNGAEVVSVVSPARIEGRGMTMLEED